MKRIVLIQTHEPFQRRMEPGIPVPFNSDRQADSSGDNMAAHEPHPLPIRPESERLQGSAILPFSQVNDTSILTASLLLIAPPYHSGIDHLLIVC